jgi:hypothetical protein
VSVAGPEEFGRGVGSLSVERSGAAAEGSDRAFGEASLPGSRCIVIEGEGEVNRPTILSPNNSVRMPATADATKIALAILPGVSTRSALP